MARFCPFLPIDLSGADFTLSGSSSSVAASSGCQFAEVWQVAASYYQDTTSFTLSSDVFIERPPNTYTIVYNENNVLVGQITSAGFDRAPPHTVVR